MAIQNPIIAAGPTKSRVRIYDQPMAIGAGAPTGTPDYEGQLYFEFPTLGEQKYYIYVGVDISGTLTWVAVATQEYIDNYTGKTWNPLSGVKGT